MVRGQSHTHKGAKGSKPGSKAKAARSRNGQSVTQDHLARGSDQWGVIQPSEDTTYWENSSWLWEEWTTGIWGTSPGKRKTVGAILKASMLWVRKEKRQKSSKLAVTIRKDNAVQNLDDLHGHTAPCEGWRMYFYLAACPCPMGDHLQLHWAISQHAWGPFALQPMLHLDWLPPIPHPCQQPPVHRSSPAQTQGRAERCSPP